ncbi:hypothetical protein PC128_g27051, partial [Phytophthora cactorum]
VVTVVFASSNPTISATTSVSHAQSKVTEVSSPALRVGDTNQKEQDNEEERAGGTGIVKWAHGLDDKNAKIVRQIAKGRSPNHTLDKMGVPFQVINGERVYSKYNKDYALYVKWLKKYRDDPLTFP